jgi:uracil-DNA glycosylase
MNAAPELGALERIIVNCRACPRLNEWREAVAVKKTARFRDWDYWGKPVPGFGDPSARLLVVGLAPAAHGGNRTGRVFTGDKSGDWLYRALHRAGFANQPLSAHRADGLTLRDCYVCAVVRCAPPDNKPLPEETARCRPFLERELSLLKNVAVIVALGKFAFDNILTASRRAGVAVPVPRPKFGHHATCTLANGVTLIASYHPSQQNTATGTLTEPMLDAVFASARATLAKENENCECAP